MFSCGERALDMAQKEINADCEGKDWMKRYRMWCQVQHLLKG